MHDTYWENTFTGAKLTAFELADLEVKARFLYAANVDIFDDEADALTALGAVPLLRLAAAHG